MKTLEYKNDDKYMYPSCDKESKGICVVEINKNLKGRRITVKVRKQVASWLSCYEMANYPLYKLHWLLFVSVLANIIPAG